MKKIILCLLGVILTAGLIALVVWFGDNTAPKPTDPSTTVSPTTTTDDTSASQTQPTSGIQVNSPMVSISLPILVETDTADNGTEIFRRTYQDVVLSIPDADITKNVTLDLLRRMDANSSVLSAIQTSAYADYSGQTPWRSYYYKILYSAMRIDETVLSLYGAEDIYSSTYSGVNGVSVNYNLLTGSALKLSDILVEESTAAEKLLSALVSVLDGMKEDHMLFDDYADTVNIRFQTELQRDNSWYFSAEGLSFFFAPYEIAPHASGIVVATVPYSELDGILQNIYFPAEQASSPGQLTAEEFDVNTLGSFTSFSELITDPDAPRYILSTDGLLYNVKIEQGQWITDTRFEADAIIYTANHLSPTDALVLRANLQVAEAALRISYRSGDADFCFYITADTTGNLSLTHAESFSS